ncbi:uncharacterized protein PV07_06997 [Cladophialophora immunda]|uniref:Major facilitator superfamily (MFS) profile domain-containing protein n=1 Tax=Cladophialophora immunda TaxID=569365 RepID=A0A0D1ZH16_9EURO|nr:uncharacterized protein PV07_06997 [Cladophialophora immunda]KIW27241.1 hypothetical protein PV07_06997 [Cladophialophora immunda]OQV02023.1 hypothetical protein CLAIMM_07280 [Cladophialophora immunda]
MPALQETHTDSSNQYQDWSDENDPSDPRNWSTSRKVLTTVICCLIGFITTMAASIYAPGTEQVQADFGVSSTVSILPLSTYTLGLAFGPVISSPLSETFGRKAVFVLTLPLFDVFVVGSGLSRSIGSLITCRFFAGLFAAPGVSVTAATIADCLPPSSRAVPLAIYYSVPFMGSALGPLVGGFAVQSRGWRWTCWAVLLPAALIHPSALFLRESYKATILRRRARAHGVAALPGSHQTFRQALSKLATSTIIRPLHMLGTEPLVGFICLYTGFQFALLYTFVVTTPWVLRKVYGFSPSGQNLSFLGLVTGCLVASCVLILVDRFFYQPRYKQLQAAREQAVGRPELPPETKLLAALYGSLMLPTGLFWFAWSTRPSVHWINSIIAQAVIMLGSLLIYVPCSFFMLDVYGSKYGASSSGASSLSRYTLSAAFPLFVTQMYERLGVDWGSSLLGFLALAMAPIPWLFSRFGPALRARSAYEHGT